jgi:hypothetical protein
VWPQRNVVRLVFLPASGFCGAAAEFEVFGAEACRVIGDGQADEVAFAAVGKIRRISMEV